MTSRRVRAFASWMISAPTPPAAPITRSTPVLSRVSARRSNRLSHAVMTISGSAAASATDSVRGAWPTMLSSTRWNRAFVPERSICPA
ncbi:hypothetical protein [Microbacterium sp. JAI119]|uniref:hypothetical protein n=1 Tax=Microbacterium TaxID=33882 RepID=UPI0015CBAC14|nr:hypothetical protein [Microbacterium sp. JAI119]NYF29004.1 hypothetical protein [Microbacterium sp. JAI119]